MKGWPKFTITDLLWLTVAVALGFAAAKSPTPQGSWGAFNGYVVDMRLPDALEATGCWLLLFALVQHARQLRAFPRLDSKPAAFAFRLRASNCLALAGMLGVLWGVRLSLNQQLVDPPERTEHLQIWSTLWPDILILVVSFASMRLFLLPRAQRPQTSVWRIAITVAVVICVLAAGVWMLTYETLITMLVHVATSSIEATNPTWLQRQGTFPNHVAEGHWSFWVSTAAAIGTVLGGVLLLLDKQLANPRTRFVVRIGFTSILVPLAVFAWWFWNSEFPRISPDLASAGTAQHWSDKLGATLLLCGMAVGLATICSREAVTSDSPLQVRTGGLLALSGAMLVAVAAAWWLVVLMRINSSFAAGVAARDLTYLMQQVMDAIILVPEALLRLLVLISALALLWQAILRPNATKPIAPISPRRFTYHLVAWAVLLAVGVPALWAFALCYWLGPFVL